MGAVYFSIFVGMRVETQITDHLIPRENSGPRCL